jgi:hypothetical protein
MISSATIKPDRTSWHLFREMTDALQWWKTLRDLRDTGQDLPSDAATIIRLFKSKHVTDLKLIAGVTVWLLFLGIAAIVYSNWESVNFQQLIACLSG